MEIPYSEAATGAVLKKGVLKKIYKIYWKTRLPDCFFNKVAGLRPETLAQVFFCEFFEMIMDTFFTEHLLVTTSAYFSFNDENAKPFGQVKITL